MTKFLTRRTLLTLAAPAILIGCDRLGATPSFKQLVLGAGEWLGTRIGPFVVGDALAPEFAEAEMSPDFRVNGNTMPNDPAYAALMQNGFANWTMPVSGLVTNPARYTLANLKALPQRTQITLHNCVEGWSAIGKWTGVPLADILKTAGVQPDARFVIFRCADDFSGTPYYESIDLRSAMHPQTILAHTMNDAPLPVGHGAPVRLRVERKLGYKHAKFIMGIDVVASLDGVGKGKGGFWEDVGDYDWYAGI